MNIGTLILGMISGILVTIIARMSWAEMKRKEKKMVDRFFLEEIVYRLKNNELDYVETLTGDWLKEMIEFFPLDEMERIEYIKKTLGAETIGERYFHSEGELAAHLKGD